MAVADDSSLMRMAEEPTRELFPLLRAAETMKPLVVLLALLPALVVLVSLPLDDQGAMWGLKSLSILTATDPQTVVDPTVDGVPLEVQWYPPLGTWISALFLVAVGSEHAISLFLASYLGTVIVIIVVYELGRRLEDARTGILAAFCLAFQASFVQDMMHPAPHAVGLALTVLTLWAYLCHLQEATPIVSYALLLSGIGLGCCVLATGGLSVVVFLILGIATLSSHGPSQGAHSRVTDRAAIRAKRRLRRAISLLVLALTTFAIGGWWELMMNSRHDNSFWSLWLTGIFPEATDGAATQAVMQLESLPMRLLNVGSDLLLEFQGLIVIMIFGAFKVVEGIRLEQDSARRVGLRMLLAWGVTGLLVWTILSLSMYETPAGILRLWQAFTDIALTLTMAFGFSQMMNRRTSFGTIVRLTVVSLMLSAFLLYAGSPSNISLSVNRSIGFVLIAIGAISVWLLHKLGGQDEVRRRRLLRGCVLSLLGTQLIIGSVALVSTSNDNADLTAFRDQLLQIEDVDRCTLITDQPPPPQLLYTIRSVWPTADLDVVDRGSTAPALTLPTTLSDSQAHTQIIINWGMRHSPLTNANGRRVQLNTISAPQFLQNQLLSIYRVANRLH